MYTTACEISRRHVDLSLYMGFRDESLSSQVSDVTARVATSTLFDCQCDCVTGLNGEPEADISFERTRHMPLIAHLGGGHWV